MEFRDYYATLGVSKTATDKELKQAYRKLARKFHPDVNPGDKNAETRFKEINEAYEVLGDPAKRKKYDELGANWRMYEQAQEAGGAYGGPRGGTWTVNVGPDGQTLTMEDFEQMFGGGAPGGAAQGFGTEGSFSDFFRTFFGGAEPSRPRAGRSANRRRHGHDLETDITLTLDDAFQGTRKRLSLKRDGHSRTVEVRLPPGVKEGARMRVAGEGEAGVNGGSPGDLFLRVHVLPHDRFERRGQDLHTTVQVPLTTVVLGGETEVTTLGGKVLRLKVPETTQDGQVLRLRGHGMPSTQKEDGAGDLYVTVHAQLPKTLTPELRKHFEEIAKAM